jgi:hypothetical protein
LPTRGFPNTLAFELASETSAHLVKRSDLDAAPGGIKVNFKEFPD